MTDRPSTSGANDEDEDDTARALRRALGATKHAPELREFLLSLGIRDPPSDSKTFAPSCEYVNYRPHGLSLCFEGGKLDCVHCYAGCDGFGTYAGGLPTGVALTSAAADVVRKLGEPTSKGGQGRMIWLSYDHLGVKFDVAASGWDEPDARLTSVAIWDASGYGEDDVAATK